MTVSIAGVTYTQAAIQDVVVNPDDPFDDNWLFLEQEYFPDEKQHADYMDVYNMQIRAASGLSAQSYVADACPVDIRYEDGLIVIPLEFYVFVPRDDFDYELSTNVAEEFSEGVYIKGSIQNDGVGYVRKGYSTAFTMTDTLEFTHRIADLSYWWESSVYDVTGSKIRGPSGAGSGINKAVSLDQIKEWAEQGITVNISPAQLRARGRYITAGEDIFGVVRLKYRAIAKLHKLNLYLEPQADAEFRNIRPVIIAKWEVEGTTKTQTLTLDIPQCVYDSIKVCSNGVDTILLINPFKNKYIVYYSTCDGSFIEAREAGSYKADYLKAER